MVLLPTLLLILADPNQQPRESIESIRYWSDGNAEVDAYHLQRERYGAMRDGRLVLIYVKEPFVESTRVKADPGKHAESDVFDVMKVNIVEQFQTGIYDYSLMTSAFFSFEARKGEPAGALTKLVFSSQEWCGVLFDELIVDPGRIRQRRFSYFDGEGDEARDFSRVRDSIFAEELLVLVRGIFGERHKRGETRTYTYYPALAETRLQHSKFATGRVTIARAANHETVKVPAGEFTVEAWTLTPARGEETRYWVETNIPRRIVRIQGPRGFDAKLSGSKRMRYWELTKPGDEAQLSGLGLQPPARR